MRRFVGFLLVLAVAVSLAACSSLGIGSGGSPPARALDTLGDDIAGAVLAFDIPTSLEPVPDASIVAFKFADAAGDSRRIDARLVPAHADELMGSLPPPAAERTYYLFAFSTKDQQKLRDAQAWARTRPAGTITLQVDLLPEFCTTDQIDPAGTRFSILATLRGVTLEPLMNAVSIADLVKARGGRLLPVCAGHSG